MSIEELSKICDESGAKLKKKVIVAISEYGKDIYNLTPDDWISVLKGFKLQTVSILELRREAIKIYEHGIYNHMTVYNPFLSPELSTENISAQINQFIYVSQEQLNDAVYNLSDDLIGGCISQLIYEGARSYPDIFELNMDDIDFSNNKINFNGYIINASQKLMEYVRSYDENDVYITNHYSSKSGEKSFKLQRVRENSFVKAIVYSNNSGLTDSKKAFQSSCTQIFMKLGYSCPQVYNSGLINFLFKKCDYSINRLSEMFADRTTSKLLDEYAKEYGFVRPSVKYYLKDYYNSFMIQNAPFI